MPDPIDNLDSAAFLRGEELVINAPGRFRMRRLVPSDFDVLLKFRAYIVAAVGNPEIQRLMVDEPTFVAESLDPRNFATGLFDGDMMVAQNSQFWPQNDEDLRSLGIYEAVRKHASPEQITFAGGVMVDPRHRGAGLQRFLWATRRTICSHEGRAHHVSTVSLENHYSWRNIITMGGRVIAVHDFDDPRYGETHRMLLLASPAAPALAQEKLWVDALDVGAHRAALANGFVGATFRETPKREIAYQRAFGG